MHLLPPIALLLVGGLAGLAHTDRHDEVERGFITAGDVRLYYEKAGDGPVLIVPGRLFVFADFRRLADRYTVISYDMRNRGRSDAVADDAAISIQADVADLEAVRRHFGVERFTPVGYSYLGLMVVLYALEHPARVERLVQLDPVPLRYDTAYRAQFAAPDWAAAFEPGGLERLRELQDRGEPAEHPREYCETEWRITRRALVGDPAHVDRLPEAAEICSMPNEWPVNLRRHLEIHFEGSVQHLDVPREKVAALDVPVLTVHGTKDRNAPYGGGREWVYLLREARLLTVPGAAHQAFAEAPELVFPAIETFLRGEWPAGSERVTEDPRQPAGGDDPS